jgi:hypothetical protein
MIPTRSALAHDNSGSPCVNVHKCGRAIAARNSKWIEPRPGQYPRSLKEWMTKCAAAGALLLCVVIKAFAGSITQPGETIGTASGAPAPQGIYFANLTDWGCKPTSPQRLCLGVDIPVLVWSTPWTIFGARLQLATAATNAVGVNIHDTTSFSGLADPFSSVQVAWDLGGGWGLSYMLGGYLKVGTQVAYSSSSLNQRFALSYTGDNWDLTTNVIWGVMFDQVTNRPQISPCPVSMGFPSNGCNPNFVNVDLTATKKFGRWEVGPVGFISSDLSTPVPNYRRQSQFALGGLIGYWFDRAIIQVYVTTDVYQKNYGANDTRGWVNVVIPLGNPSGPSPLATPIAH